MPLLAELCLITALGQAPVPPPPTNATVVAPPPSQATITKVEDDGLLQHAYFGAVIPFAPDLGVDDLWIKTGLNLKGKQVTYGSWETKVLRAGRQEKDLQRAATLARLIPDTLMPRLREVFQGSSLWQLGGSGDYRFEGRIVDANVPNTASKLVFGWLGGKENLENVTWDMKLVDAATGETVMAFHHRMVKVNTLGSLEASLRDWTMAFPERLAARLR